MTRTEQPYGCRHATLADTAALLRQRHAAQLDVVLSARDLRAVDGLLRITGAGEPVLSIDGVTASQDLFRPTGTCDDTLADKLKIPTQYLRRTRRHPHLYDTNVNTWLDDDPNRRLLVRTLRDTGTGGGIGIGRAVLSHQYRILDDLDVLMAVLAGLRDADAEVDITQCDLTERRMYVKIRSARIAAHAPALLQHYVSPFTGQRGADNPLVFAGLVIRNSETGHGRFAITPQITVQVCDNGLTITQDELGEVHLGGRLPDGVVTWSADTRDTHTRLITKQARDAVTTFLTEDYLQRKITEIQRTAGVPIRDVPATLTHVAKQLHYTDEQQATILRHFITGADSTSGGVLHAVTSTAQTLADADTAYTLERTGLRAMALAASYQS
jgi:hypothetical protein